ncbi:hypothetical protein OG317_36785 [Streptomyces sp. NBC_01167]|uniref:hypothetical protein n=1 Tax=Streptomyces sp. NBC_01167 TaxID=2903756 RepID=UPI00386F4BCD|nr:hypothetical protein OG317_36785 [Streptomyces sp. NBC_01167]
MSLFEQLPPTPQIRDLYLGTWTVDSDLTLARTALPRLEKLTIACHGAHRLVDLTPLIGMPDLTSITIRSAHEIVGTENFPPGTITRTPRPRT